MRRAATVIAAVLVAVSFASASARAAEPIDTPPGGPEAGPLADRAIALGGYVGLTPARLLDTRLGLGAPMAAVGPNSMIELDVAGRGGVPANAIGVMLNLTGTEPTAETYVTVWPAGQARPTASNLNLRVGETRPNAVAIGLGANGRVALYNFAGSTHLIVDVTGYMLPREQGGAGFVALSPDRLLDTRSGLGAPAAPVAGGSSIDLQVAGRGGVPLGARAAVLNVTAAEATAPGYVTVWPTGAPRPTASNLNVVAGQVVPNMVVATLSADGRASLFHFGQSVHLIADVLGYFSDSVIAAAGTFTPITPTRVEDTRENFGYLSHDNSREIDLDERNDLVDLDLPATASAVVVNVTAVGAMVPGYLTARPTGTTPPTSTLNVVPGDVVPNLAVVPISDPARPSIEIYNFGGLIHVVVDVVGYFSDDAAASSALAPDMWWTSQAAVLGDGTLMFGAIRDGTPVIVRCADRVCSSRSTVELTEVPAGQGTGFSIRVAPDGLARVLVNRSTAPQVNAPTSRSHFVRCLNATCSQRTTNTHDGSAQMALDAQGRGVLYRVMQNWSSNFYPVRVDRCADDACSSLTGGAVLEPNQYALNARFSLPRFDIDPSGRPVLLFNGVTQTNPSIERAMVYLRCNNADCTSYTGRALGTAPDAAPDGAPVDGEAIDLAYDAAGRPIIVWTASVNVKHPFTGGWFSLYQQSRIIRCADVICDATAETDVRGGADRGMAASTAVVMDSGTIVLAGWDNVRIEGTGTVRRARLASCLDAACAVTALAAMRDDSTVFDWRVLEDPAGGLFFLQADPDGVHIEHLGEL